jgi:hypothetical protein
MPDASLRFGVTDWHLTTEAARGRLAYVTVAGRRTAINLSR